MGAESGSRWNTLLESTVPKYGIPAVEKKYSASFVANHATSGAN
jgi:hypothetical protein